MKSLLTATALFEFTTGVVLESDPSAASRLLLGTPLDSPAALVITRVLGAALIAIGAGCWFTRDRADAGLLAALLLYNLGAVAVLVDARIGLGLSGLALWPAVILHAALAVWCLACLRTARRDQKSADSWEGEAPAGPG
ncbi:MAG TPA: hypothetical protein VGH33_06340 [Isosphaeraceae bacterium]|jgi:hypothetical protein